MLRNDHIIRLVQHGLDVLDVAADAPTEEWTRAVKTRLCELGRLFQYWVYARRTRWGEQAGRRGVAL